MDDEETEQQYPEYQTEEEQTPNYNTGLDQVNRLNYTLWLINEGFRLKDYEMVSRLLDNLMAELVSELKDDEFDKIMDRRDAILKLKDEYDVYNMNFSRCKDRNIVYMPPKQYAAELYKFNLELRRWVKKKGLGMPTHGEFDGI